MDSFFASLTDPATAFAHVALILLLAASMFTSMRMVRIAALAAGVAALVHVFGMQGGGGFGFWIVLLVIANAVQLAILIGGSRLGNFHSEERQLLEHVLQVEDPGRQRRLLDLLEWRDTEIGDVLIREGQAMPPLIYIASGAASVEHDDRIVGVCGAGDFIGDMSIVSGEKASATVTVTNRMRIAVFDRDALVQLSRSTPEIRSAFNAALNRGLAAKVLRMNEMASGD